MHFAVLGRLEVRDDAGTIVPITAPKQQALLSLLLMRSSRVVSSDAIADALWADTPPASAATAIRFHVSKLRSVIEQDDAPELIVTISPGYRMMLAGHWFDAHRFETLVEEGRVLLQAHPDRAYRAFVEALSLWRGRAYETVEGEEFAGAEIARLERLRDATVRDRIDAELRLGRSAALVHELEALVESSPTDERLAAMLMRALYASGRAADALHAATALRHELGALGLEASPSLTELEDKILLHDSVLPASTEQGRAGSLPIPLSPFLGRTEEAASLGATILERRLVTVVGPPGCGKTRLALEVARSAAADFDAGAHLVELSEIIDPDLVERKVGGVFGVAEMWGGDYLAVLAERLRSDSVLLVIDNAEHLLDSVAALARYLLERCPDVRLLVTSRIPLGVPGEVAWHLQPLAVPSPAVALDEALDYPAVRLFVDRAAVARAGFELTEENRAAVVEICRHVDGLPLAIELAAAGTAGLSVTELALRLRSVHASLPAMSRSGTRRQRTMEEAVRWSVDLLEPLERAVFFRLATFSGGMTMAAAEQVAGFGDVPQASVFDIVLRLVHTSLLVAERHGEEATRYRMLTVVRDFAIGAAEDEEWAEAASRHADYFADIAAAIGPHMEGPDAEQWRCRGDLELDNFRAALEWSLGAGDPSVAFRLVPSLTWYWYWRSHLREAHRWTARTLEETVGSDHPGRTATLYAAGLFNDVIGNLTDAEDAFEAARKLAVEGGNVELEARALTGLGVVARDRGDLRDALSRFGAALDLEGESPRTNRAISLRMGGITKAMTGDPDAARHDLDAARRLYEQLGNDGGVVWSILGLGYVGLLIGDRRAVELVDTAVARFGEAHDVRGLGWGLVVRAQFDVDAADFSAATDGATSARQRFTDVGDRRGLGYANLALADAALRTDDIAAASGAAAESRRHFEALPDTVGLCRLACAAASLAFAQRRRQEQRRRLVEAVRFADRALYPWGFVSVLASEGATELLGDLTDPEALRAAIAAHPTGAAATMATIRGVLA